MFKSVKPNKLRISALVAAISLIPCGAYAAGLGKVTVMSPLGQPLRAEVDMTASREELSSMTAKLASPDAFQKAGIEYVSAMTGIRVAVEKRPNGDPYLRLFSDRPVNEPFLDLLLEITWSSGRVVREYTMLLDPPEALKVAAPAPVVAPVVRTPARPVAAPKSQPSAETVTAMPVQQSPAPVAQPQQDSHQVERGDTLSKIAGATKPEGVSLDQMLVALFRNNQDAFDGGNMNRLKTGKILRIPDQAAVESVSAGEARKIVRAHVSDFNAYRQKLAGTVAAAPAAKEEGPKQEATGRIAAKAEDKAVAPQPGQDKLEISRTETAKQAKAAQERISALEEDLVARDKAIKEANSRIAELERNLDDLKKLAELKSQAGAQMQQQAQAAKPVPATPPAATPVQVPAATTAEKPAEPVVSTEGVKPVDEPKLTEEAKPAEEVKPAEAPPAPVAEAPKPAPQPAEPVAPPPPIEEPSFLDDNAALVYGGGGLLVLLLAYLGYAAKRRKGSGGDAPTTSRITEGDLMANSVFGATGGQSVDTGASIQTDFSQSNLAAIDADEGVDPVAEADVYMAYGRDAQAEEILIDALKNDPNRHAIHLKLLEIYSGRKSVKQFESLATDLYSQTGGAGPDWEKAAAMGRELDPANSLYGSVGGEAAAEAAASPEEGLVVPASEAQKLRETVVMQGELGGMAAAAKAAEGEPLPAMDFDLELPATDTDVGHAEPPAEMEAAATDIRFETTPMDMNIEASILPKEEGEDEDATVPMGMRMTPAVAEPESGGLDFEFDLDAAAAPSVAPMESVPESPAVPEMDFSSIDLNLDDTSTQPDANVPMADVGASGLGSFDIGAADQDDPDITTKIELAQAYEEMGDKEGARELLQEVIQEGSAHQQEIARGKLAALGA